MNQRAPWTKEKRLMLRTMRDDAKLSWLKIAECFGISVRAVQAQYNKLHGLHGDSKPLPDQATAKPKVFGAHLQAYNRTRRGFDVPQRLEAQYFDLLRKGVPIAEAARQLGLSPRSNP